MTEQLKSYDLREVVKFAAVLSTTDRINDLSAKLTSMAEFSRAAGVRTGDLSSNTARMVARSHALATACQCKCSVAPKESNQSTSFLEKAVSVMFVKAGFIAAAKVWRDQIALLLKTSAGSFVVNRGVAAVRSAGE